MGVLNGVVLQQSPWQQQRTQTDTQSNAPNAVVTPTPTENKPSPNPQSQNTNTQSYDWQEWWRPEPLTNIALTIVAIWAACVALRTLKIIDRQTKANTREASAAVRQARISERQLYLTSRARMGLKQITVPVFAHGSELLFTFEFENYGGKGAMIEESSIDFSISGTMPQHPTYFDTVGLPVEASNVCRIFRECGPISKQDWAKITDENGKIRLKVCGEIRYQVGFGNAGLKRLGFCLQYDPRATRLGNNTNTNNVTFVPIGGKLYNYAD